MDADLQNDPRIFRRCSRTSTIGAATGWRVTRRRRQRRAARPSRIANHIRNWVPRTVQDSGCTFRAFLGTAARLVLYHGFHRFIPTS